MVSTVFRFPSNSIVHAVYRLQITTEQSKLAQARFWCDFFVFTVVKVPKVGAHQPYHLS